MPRKRKIPEKITISSADIPKHLQKLATENKQSLKDVTIDSLQDGFALFIQETATGKATVQYIDLYPSSQTRKEKPATKIREYRRLRNEFAPIGAGVDFLKDQILGSGIDAGIDKITDSLQKEIREWVREFVDNVYQDSITVSINEILDIMLDEALTVGASAAEICYEKNIDFKNYVTSAQEIKTEVGREIIYILRDPDWENDENLGRITRLKIIPDGYRRIKAHKHPQSWDINFWTLDEKTDQPLVTGGIMKQADGKKLVMYHPWEIFWLAINRRNSDRFVGESVIAQVYDTALLLEKIEKSIGEGLYRAGNKKYFIVCGTEKRPWGKDGIRNFMKLLKEMSKKGWGSIPVPAGFDIKEIGGQVFEGRDIVDHFVGMLAFGLGVPKDAISMARGRATGTATDIATSKISRRRDILARAIKRQLFSRHTWCKYGKEKNKQGGKGTKQTWIPPVKWLTEGFMTRGQEMEALFKSLNVANPLLPENSLEVNRRLSELFGFEVDLPTQEEYMKRIKEAAEQRPQFKQQGPPEPQTLERQEKRQEGMQKKGEGKGQAKTQGTVRQSKEAKANLKVEETERENKIKRDALATIEQELKIDEIRERIRTQKELQKTERKRQKIMESD